MNEDIETNPAETNEFEDLAGRLTENEPETPEETEETPETLEETEGTDETSEEIIEDEPEVTEPEEEPEKEAQGFPKEQEDKDHQAFAKLRVEKARMESIVARLAEKEGLSVDDYEAKLQSDEREAEAAEANVPIEFYNRLKELESAEVNRQKEHEAAQFRNNVERFQNKQDLSEPELRGFIDKCFDNGIDLTTAGIDMDILYKGLNYDTMVEKERQQWISKDKQNRTSTSKTGSKGTTPSVKSGATVSTSSDLKSILDNINQ